jgi:microcystin-dependent protein
LYSVLRGNMALIAGVQYSGNPVGTIMSFSGANAPARTLLCNGDIIPNGTGTVQGITADFSALFAIIGSTYGVAGQLPDTRNVFLRGANASTRSIGGVTYPAVARGTTTNDRLQGHRHSYYGVNNTGTGSSGFTILNTTNGPFTGGLLDPTTDGTNGNPRTGTETAPVHLGVNYCIAF